MTIIEDNGETWIESHEVFATTPAAISNETQSITSDRPGTYLGGVVCWIGIGDPSAFDYIGIYDDASGNINLGDNITGFRIVGRHNGSGADPYGMQALIHMRKAT